MTTKKSNRPKGHALEIKRIYDPPGEDDGMRILVDRLWPRGIAKEKAHIDLWLKEIAPSNDLRHRIHTDPGQWDAFVLDYAHELMQEPAHSAVAILRGHLDHGKVTLLYAARDEIHNNAIALKAWLDRN